MVEELDAEECAALVQAQGDPAVFRTGAGVATGIIVHDDDRGAGNDPPQFAASDNQATAKSVSERRAG